MFKFSCNYREANRQAHKKPDAKSKNYNFEVKKQIVREEK